ncbi:hypothetical protein Hanom_Chr08g00725001 [Helianthus anomalus]
MMAKVVEIPEIVTESKGVDEVVPEVVDEVVPEVVDEVVPEVVEKVSTEGAAEVEETVAEVLNYQSQQEKFDYTMKSIMPSNVFDSFADCFEEPRTGTYPRFEEQKEAVEEVIDV